MVLAQLWIIALPQKAIRKRGQWEKCKFNLQQRQKTENTFKLQILCMNASLHRIGSRITQKTVMGFKSQGKSKESSRKITSRSQKSSAHTQTLKRTGSLSMGTAMSRVEEHSGRQSGGSEVTQRDESSNICRLYLRRIPQKASSKGRGELAVAKVG